MDAISMLKDDHKKVRTLFRDAQNAGDDRATQAELAQQIVQELTIHAFIEETVFYPAARAEVPEVEDMILESLEEHHIVKWVCSELRALSPDDEQFDAKLTVLGENVEHHVQEEEKELFPKVRKGMGRNRLNELGEDLAAAKREAPTEPVPDKQPTATARKATAKQAPAKTATARTATAKKAPAKQATAKKAATGRKPAKRGQKAGARS